MFFLFCSDPGWRPCPEMEPLRTLRCTWKKQGRKKTTPGPHSLFFPRFLAESSRFKAAVRTFFVVLFAVVPFPFRSCPEPGGKDPVLQWKPPAGDGAKIAILHSKTKLVRAGIRAVSRMGRTGEPALFGNALGIVASRFWAWGRTGPGKVGKRFWREVGYVCPLICIQHGLDEEICLNLFPWKAVFRVFRDRYGLPDDGRVPCMSFVRTLDISMG